MYHISVLVACFLSRLRLQSDFLLRLIYVAYNVSPRICDSDFSFFLSPDNNFDVVLFKIKTDINEELFFSLTKLKLYHSHAMKTKN
jgi:hypothetical protein